MKQIIHFILGKLGYRIVRIEDGPRRSERLDPFFILLKRFRFAPKHILYVGANRGLWTREAIKFFPEACYTLVEPRDYLKTHIQDLLDRGSKIQWIHAGASDCPGTMPFILSSRQRAYSYVRAFSSLVLGYDHLYLLETLRTGYSGVSQIVSNTPAYRRKEGSGHAWLEHERSFAEPFESGSRAARI